MLNIGYRGLSFDHRGIKERCFRIGCASRRSRETREARWPDGELVKNAVTIIAVWWFQTWVWVNTYRYIFSGMNIHLPAILMFTRGTRF